MGMERRTPDASLWPSSESIPHNLPAPLTSLIGREADLAHVAALVARDRLVTLVGSAGIGKTLAVHAAVGILDEYPDGVWFADLSLVTQPSLVVQAVASAMGARERTDEDLNQTLIARLARGRQLVVLDNCEHLRHACADLVCRLVRGCGNLRILATSREPLGVIGEAAWRVSPLQLPTGESPNEVLDSDAARLFTARAAEDLTVNGATAASIAHICQRLDGVPLAIELAAGRLGELTPKEIEADLEHRLVLLSTDRVGLAERHRSFQTALEWSHDLLSEPERTLFRRLAVFVGPFTATASTQVGCRDRIGDHAAAGVVARLAAKSLLVSRTDVARVHYRMHASVRQFALEKLCGAGEEEWARSSHARWCADLAARSDGASEGPEQTEHMALLVDVQAEFPSALSWALHSQPDLALVLAADLTRFWTAHGHLAEGRTWLEQALAAGASASPARSKALWGSGLIACLLGDFPAVGPALEEGLALARKAHDETILARLLNLVGVTRIFTDPPAAAEALAEAIALARRHGETVTLVSSLTMQGFARTLCGHLEAAADSLEECMAAGAGFGDGQPLLMGMIGLGHVRVQQGEPIPGRHLLDDGLAMARRVGNPVWIALALAFLAELETILGRDPQAHKLSADAVAIARKTGAAPVLGLCLAIAGNVESAAGNPARSIGLFDEALSLCATGERGGVRARALVGAGQAHLSLGKLDEAQVVLETAVMLAEHQQNRIATSAGLHLLGKCAGAKDDYETALGLHREALTLQSRAGHLVAMPGSIEAIAAETAQQGDTVKATQLCACANALRASAGQARSADDRANCEIVSSLANERLEPEVREAAARSGENLPAARVLTYACAGHGPRKRPACGWLSLTPSETSVIELLAEHLTNVEIGACLIMAPGTVKTHLAHVYDKLGLRSRREVAREFSRRVSASSP